MRKDLAAILAEDDGAVLFGEHLNLDAVTTATRNLVTARAFVCIDGRQGFADGDFVRAAARLDGRPEGLLLVLAERAPAPALRQALLDWGVRRRQTRSLPRAVVAISGAPDDPLVTSGAWTKYYPLRCKQDGAGFSSRRFD